MAIEIPAYLIGGAGCEKAIEFCRGCAAAVKVNPATGRYYITMGHPGFNTPTNNARGYATEARAISTVRRLAA